MWCIKAININVKPIDYRAGRHPSSHRSRTAGFAGQSEFSDATKTNRSTKRIGHRILQYRLLIATSVTSCWG